MGSVKNITANSHFLHLVMKNSDISCIACLKQLASTGLSSFYSYLFFSFKRGEKKEWNSPSLTRREHGKVTSLRGHLCFVCFCITFLPPPPILVLVSLVSCLASLNLVLCRCAILESTGSQWGVGFVPQVPLATSEGIFGCHNCLKRLLLVCSVVEPRDAAKSPTVHRTVLTTKNAEI